MRKVLYSTILIILFVAQIGCSTNWDERYNEFPFETCTNEQIQLDKNELTFPYYGGSNQVIVNANVTWTAISNDSWISATKNGAGTAVAIEIQRNTKNESRQGSFTIHGVEKTYTVNVIQEASPEELQPNYEELYFPYHGGSNMVLVSSNVNWSVSSDSPWISVMKNDIGTAFAVELKPNESASIRQGTIYIKGVNLVCTVSITQAGAPDQIQLSPDQLSFPPHGGSNQVLVSANTDWSVRSDVTWISVEKNEVNTAFAVMCEPNDITELRSGNILVSTAAKSYIVKVTQDPMIERIVLNTTNLEFPYHGGSNQVIVDANVSWTVRSNASWIWVVQNDAKTAFEVRPQPNENASDRSATITVTGVRESRVVYVLQKGKR